MFSNAPIQLKVLRVCVGILVFVLQVNEICILNCFPNIPKPVPLPINAITQYCMITLVLTTTIIVTLLKAEIQLLEDSPLQYNVVEPVKAKAMEVVKAAKAAKAMEAVKAVKAKTAEAAKAVRAMGAEDKAMGSKLTVVSVDGKEIIRV